MGTRGKPGEAARVVRLSQWRPSGHRRLKLQGSRTYVCRHCRAPMRVPSAHYLPDTCAVCGASTWDDRGVCLGPSECDAHRVPGSRTPGFCHSCGYSVWVSLPMRPTEGDEAA